MKKLGKRLLAWVLALTMVLTAQGTTAFAQTAGTEDAESDYIVTTVSDDSADVNSTAVLDAISDDAEEATASASVMSTDTTDKETYFNAQLKAALDSYSTSFTLDTSYGITADEYKAMYSEFLYDNYCYFYADPASYGWTTSSGVVNYVEISYKLDGVELDVSDSSVQEDLEAKVDALEEKVENILSEACTGSDLEKALYVHDYLAQNCEYDLSYKKDTIYNALVEGSAVCEGYALAFLALVRELGLNCEVVTISDYDGNGSGHMWNLVEVDGSWYHVDVTWDDPIYSGATANDSYGTDVLGRVEHYFFLKSTDYFQSTEVSGSVHQDVNGDAYVYSDSHTDEDASDDTYDEYFWNSVDSAFEYVDETWYGLTTQENESGLTEAYIYSYVYEDGDFEPLNLILTFSDYWTINDAGQYLKGNYSYLAAYDNLLYYNTSDTIYAYDTVYEVTTAIYSIEDTKASNEFMYGFGIDESGYAYYLLCSYSSSSGISRTGVVKALNVENAIGSYYELTLSEDTYTYDGTAKTPDVTVSRISDSSVILTKNTDYTVTYTDNVNAGTATVTVTGINDFEGTLEAEFTIEKADRTLTLKNTTDGTDITDSTVSMKYAEYLYIQASASAGDGKYSFSNSTSSAVFTAKDTSSGTCTVQAQAYSGSSVITVTIAETDNYNSASATVTVNCSKLTQTLTASDVSLTYGGNGIQISPKHTTDGGAITYSTSNKKVATVGETTGIVKPTGAGTATITITAAGTDKYAEAVTTINVTVAQATQTVTVSKTSLSVNMGSTVTISASTNGDGTLKYTSADTSIATVSSTGKITPKKAGTVKITVYAAAGTNYSQSSSKTVTVTIGLAAPTISSVKQSNTTTTVTWGKVSGASGYYVYRSTSSSSIGSKIKTITSGSTVSYKDTASKTNGTTYYYRVYAYSGSTKSAASSAKSIKYMKGTVSSLTNTSSGVTVKWSKVSGATGYYIYRKAGSGSYSKVKTITSASTTSWSDTGVKSKNGTTYTYYVQPYNKTSTGAYATKTTVRLTAVSLSSVTNSSSKKMTVKWAKNSKATGYQIQYSTSSSFASGNKTVTVSSASTVSKVISSLTKGKTYYVRIRVYKTVSGTKYYSAWSSKKSVKISK